MFGGVAMGWMRKWGGRLGAGGEIGCVPKPWRCGVRRARLVALEREMGVRHA